MGEKGSRLGGWMNDTLSLNGPSSLLNFLNHSASKRKTMADIPDQRDVPSPKDTYMYVLREKFRDGKEEFSLRHFEKLPAMEGAFAVPTSLGGETLKLVTSESSELKQRVVGARKVMIT